MSTVLFVCLHNAGRSQMSAALFERAAGGRHRALSAGTTPGDRVHPEVVEVMRELGIDLADRVPQLLTRELAEQADVLVTMGCGDQCPFIPGKRYIDWELRDPKGRPLDEVRATRDDIAQPDRGAGRAARPRVAVTRDQKTTLLVTSLATAMLLLDVTIVYVALPAIQADLGASFSEMQWVIDAYTLALAATLLGAGILADRYGRRAFFAGGLVVFSLLSVLCGTAGSPLVLDLSRAAQGLGAAAMFATSLALLSAEFDGVARSRALGIWGGVTGLALALGPLVGGLVVDGLSWRWIFLVNAPIGDRAARAHLDGGPRIHRPPRRATRPPGDGRAGGVDHAARPRPRPRQRGRLVEPARPRRVRRRGARRHRLRRRSNGAHPSSVFPPGAFRRRAFSGGAIVSFGQSVVIYPLLLFLAIYFQWRSASRQARRACGCCR